MNKRLLDFSSLHPKQLIGEKKDHYSITNNSGVITDEYYTYEDTLTKNIIWDTKIGNLSPLVYALQFGVGNELINAGQIELGCFLEIWGVILPIADIVAISFVQIFFEESNFQFAPISKYINTVLFNTAIYTVALPAKLVAKVLVKKEFAHQNKLLKTNEGTQILINENKAKEENRINKIAIKKAKKELKQTKHLTKVSRQVSLLDKENDKMNEDLNKINREIEDCKKV